MSGEIYVQDFAALETLFTGHRTKRIKRYIE